MGPFNSIRAIYFIHNKGGLVPGQDKIHYAFRLILPKKSSQLQSSKSKKKKKKKHANTATIIIKVPYNIEHIIETCPAYIPTKNKLKE